VLEENGIEYISPFLNLDSEKSLLKGLCESFPDIPKREIEEALQKAKEEEKAFKEWLARRGEEVIRQLEKEGIKGIIFAGHPYHIDPAINHGISEEINRLGMGVLTEDSVAHLVDEQHVGVVNQWTFHSRLYRAADVVKKYKHLELLQVTSFGCGLDAITTDAVEEILEEANQLYTWIKMDEISNLGAARIRLRSLKAAMEERSREGFDARQFNKRLKEPEVVFDKKDKEIRTILAPQMLPTHFELFEHAFKLHGYKVKVIKEVRDEDIDVGLKYVNNDACYPAIITIGQLVAELQNGGYDLDRTAVIMSQTGGGCRATNYLALLKKALRNAGMPQVPVLSLNAGNVDGVKHPGFKLTLPLVKKLVVAGCLGDLLMRLLLAVRPYERIKGSTQILFDKWVERCKEVIEDFSMKKYKNTISAIIEDFKNIEVHQVEKPRVGIVGEILVKFHPYANNQLIEIIEQEGGEAVVPDFVDFFMYGLYNRFFKAEQLGFSKWFAAAGKIAINLIEHYRNPVRVALKESGRFAAPLEIHQIAELASKFLSLGNQMGEGWLLTGEMAELIESGVENVVCVQPL
ncbi:MAG: 2-hydroxyacyl-CoA dehydratase, partial [Bacillales bacterium]